MTEFNPSRESLFTSFIRYRVASDRWNVVYEKNLIYFDRYCSEQYPDISDISQEMVDGWCKQRETEQVHSCYTRTSIIVSFIRYLRDRGLTNTQVPTVPSYKVGKYRRTYIPHAFTHDELEKFFCECDRRAMHAKTKTKAARAMTASVVFRLIYSSGLRTVEARLLRLANVNLDQGILDIQYSKGRDQHYVVLHDSMLDIMRYYDAAICKIYHERDYFFPRDSKNPLYQEWMPLIFREIWDSVNNSSAVPYDLRHNYATTNLNGWTDSGFEFHDKFTYLSKSMGHKKTESTRYYYSIVPAFSDIIVDKTASGFDKIVPEVDDGE